MNVIWVSSKGDNMAASSRKDDLFATLAVVILLIGTATGSGIAMFVMSVITLALMVVFYRKEIRREEYRSGVLLLVLVAAVTAFVIGIVLTLL